MGSYSEDLKNPKWQRKRLKILERDNFTCTLCKDTETTLHVHHEQYKGKPWEVPDEFLHTVCEDCHRILHKEWLHEDFRKKDTQIITRVVKIPIDKDFTRWFFAFTTDQNILCLYDFCGGAIYCQLTLPIKFLNLLTTQPDFYEHGY